MAAAEKNDQSTFDRHYDELKQLCTERENTDRDHPVQWKTLTDFTEDLSSVVAIYEKALVKAEAIVSADFRSSIGYAFPTLKIELGDVCIGSSISDGFLDGHLNPIKLTCEYHYELVQVAT